MAYKGKSFTFWVSYYDVAQELTAREQGEFFKAICDYMFAGEDPEPELRKPVRICFKAIKANLKRSVANRREVGSESGENRGEVPQPENALNLNINLKSNLNPNSKPKPARAPAACPKCGGTLEPTASKQGNARVYRCACGEEVLL